MEEIVESTPVHLLVGGKIAKTVTVPLVSEERWLEEANRTEEEWKKVVLPPGWRAPTTPGIPGMPGMEALRDAVNGKSAVFFSAGRHDGRWWLHVSLSHPDKMPSYMDLAEVKRIFIGEEREAVQVFPPASEHISFHDRCLHLWSCLEPDGSGLPKFGREGSI